MRLGAIMAIVGGIVFMIGNMLRARADDIEIYQNQIQAVAESDIWIVDYLALGIGMHFAVDGISSKFFHDAFIAAPVGETATGAAGLGVDGTDRRWALPHAHHRVLRLHVRFLRAALIQSDSFHMAYGWIALVPSILAIGIGVYQAIDGLSTVITTYAFAGVASVLNLWVIVIDVNMWRRSGRVS